MYINLRYSYPKRKVLTVVLLISFVILTSQTVSAEGETVTPTPFTDDLEIVASTVSHMEALDLIVFEMQVKGAAGKTIPRARGQVDGAPVLAYVFVTDLKPTAVGYGPVEGTLALAVTSHPDFDDTPLWDEDADSRYDNDGVVFHSHWVVLVPDKRVAGGLSVSQFREGDTDVILPPTHPGMPIYLDSPGFPVLLKGDRLKVPVPAFRIKNRTDFAFDAVTSYLQVNASDEGRPMLGVYEVYQVLSGDLSLPYRVEKK